MGEICLFNSYSKFTLPEAYFLLHRWGKYSRMKEIPRKGRRNYGHDNFLACTYAHPDFG